MSGFRNCSLCTRWRQPSDFQVFIDRGNERVRKYCTPCKKQYDKLRFKNATPEQRHIWRERCRESSATRRRREGIPARMNITKRGYGAGRVALYVKNGKLPIQPLDELILEMGINIDDLRDNLPRLIRKARQLGEITLDGADRACIELGTHLDLVYPQAMAEVQDEAHHH